MSMQKDYTNNQGMNRSLSLLSLSSISSIPECQDNKSKPATGQETAFAAFKECENTIFELAVNRLILECFRDVAANKNHQVLHQTAQKLCDIMSNFEISQYIRLPFGMTDEPTQLLGIMKLPDATLTHTEQKEINDHLESLLQVKITTFLKIYEREGYNIEESTTTAENGARKRFEKKTGLSENPDKIYDQIEEMAEKYEMELENCCEQLCYWNELKGKLQDQNLNNIENLDLQARLTEMKAKMTYMNCLKQMLNETPFTLEAFKILNAMLDRRQDQLEQDIESNEKILREYKNLRGTEFDEILREYLELNAAIEKKMIILNKL